MTMHEVVKRDGLYEVVEEFGGGTFVHSRYATRQEAEAVVAVEAEMEKVITDAIDVVEREINIPPFIEDRKARKELLDRIAYEIKLL